MLTHRRSRIRWRVCCTDRLWVEQRRPTHQIYLRTAEQRLINVYRRTGPEPLDRKGVRRQTDPPSLSCHRGGDGSCWPGDFDAQADGSPPQLAEEFDLRTSAEHGKSSWDVQTDKAVDMIVLIVVMRSMSCCGCLGQSPSEEQGRASRRCRLFDGAVRACIQQYASSIVRDAD